MKSTGILLSLLIGVVAFALIFGAINAIAPASDGEVGSAPGSQQTAPLNMSSTPLPTMVRDAETSASSRSSEPSQGVSSDSPRFFKSASELAESASVEQPTVSIAGLERDVHELVNAERLSRNLAALAWDAEIAVIARRHSEDMAANDFFSHENPQGQKAADRGDAAGYECIKVYENHYTYGLSENIFQGWLYSSITTINGVEFPNWNTQEEIAKTSVNGWMKSEGHRENILTETYDRAGIGVAIAKDDRVYITQNFC